MGVINKPSTIEKRIAEAIRTKVNRSGLPRKTMKKSKELHEKIEEILNRAILSSNEFYSLMAGQLRADFGLDDVKVAQVPSILVDLIDLSWEYEVVSQNVDNTIFKIIYTVKAGSEDSPKVINAMQTASYISTPANLTKSRELIDWLRWLLFAGGEIINEKWKVKYADGKGRSHMAIMIKGENFAFKVDGQFSGKEGSNFVSRAISTVTGEIESLIRSYTGGS